MAIDFDAIRRQFPLTSQLQRYGCKVDHKLRFKCPIPGHRDKNPSANIIRVEGAAERWWCHACNKGGDVVDLVAEVEGIADRGDAARRLWGGDPPLIRDSDGPSDRVAPNRPETKREEMGLVFDLGPIPDDAPPIRAGAETPPILSKRGKVSTATPADVYVYYTPTRVRTGLVLRIDSGDGGKKIVQVRWDKTRGWVWAGWSGADAAPLYNAPPLVDWPEKPILLLEGEKCVKLARPLLPDFTVVTWQGGCGAVKRADFSLLRGRDVTFWPDNDDPGREAMKTAMAKAGAGKSWWVEPSADWEKGYDIADLIAAEGKESALSYLMSTRVEQTPKREPGELPAPGDWQLVSRGGWVPDDIHIVRTKDNYVHSTSEINGLTGLQYHPFFASLSWDVIRRTMVFDGAPLLPGFPVRVLQRELARHTQVKLPERQFGSLVVDVAMRNLVNPLADQLRSLQWDGIARPLADYAGVRQTPWSLAAFDRWFVGLIRRILEPGCQHDLVLVLEGAQGLGKTSFLRTIAQPLGFDGFTAMEHLSSNSNDMMRLDGKIVVELAELAALHKTAREVFKNALTSTTDRYRRPYAANMVDVPRTSVFAGTTNQLDNYLTDSTGNRRIVPVSCVYPAQIAELRRDLDQVFAEGVARYDALANAGAEINWFSPAELVLQTAQTTKRESAPVFVHRLDDYLSACSHEDALNTEALWTACGLESMRDRHVFRDAMIDEMKRRGWTWARGTRDADRRHRFRRRLKP